MNYQLDSHINRPNRLVIAKPQDYQSIQSPSQQRSSSGKKVFIIRRKISTSPSVITLNNKQKSKIIVNENSQLQIGSKLSQQQKQVISLGNVQNSPNMKNKIISNPQNSRENSYQTMHLSNKQSRRQAHPSLQVSRGQQYQNQLEMIQKDVQFFRFQLQMTKNKKNQLENLLINKQQQVQSSIFNIYSCFNKIFSNQSTTMNVLDRCFPSLLDKKNFKNLIQKIGTKQVQQITLTQVEIDMRFVFKALNLAFQAIQKYQQKLANQEIKIREDEIRLKDYANQIKFVNQENNKIKIQNKRLLQTIQLHAKQKYLNQRNNKDILQSSKIDAKSIKKQQKSLLKNQQQIKSILKNTQTQTEQKRIGSAASINKYRSHRLTNTLNRPSPYRHYRYSSDASSADSKQMTASISKIRQNQLQAQTVKKTKFQPIQNKKVQNTKKININDKKKCTPTSSYLNHLIQSETLLKGDETVETLELDKKQSQLTKQNPNSRSLLKVRRPVHRSRSHSHQELPSSKQKVPVNVSINNISSRVYSTYSLNPLNKYGDKRLCNEVNSKKVRKITQLSQQSQELQERMKQLMQQEKALMQKYKHLQKVKVSRQNKKSRQNKTSLDNSRQKA